MPKMSKNKIKQTKSKPEGQNNCGECFFNAGAFSDVFKNEITTDFFARKVKRTIGGTVTIQAQKHPWGE